MRALLRRPGLLVVTAMLVVAGCRSGDAPSASDDAGQQDGRGEADEPGAEEPTATPSGRLLLSGFRDDHPGGVSLELSSIEVDADGNVLLGLDVVHAAVTNRVDIGDYHNLLEDDLGNVYGFERPEDNRSLTLPKDHRMVGTLAFAGPIDPEAKRVTLALNQTDAEDRVGAADDGRLDRTPRFVVADVPLPGVGLEEEASDPDAMGLLETRIVEVGDSQDSEDNPDVSVTVVSYETDGRVLFLDIEAVNRSSEPVAILNDRPSLRDDQGRRLQYLRVDSEELAERQLRLAPGEEGAATMAFRGGPTATSGELRLVLNSLSEGRGRERTPGFRFTLPVPEDGVTDGEDAPDAADGGDGEEDA